MELKEKKTKNRNTEISSLTNAGLSVSSAGIFYKFLIDRVQGVFPGGGTGGSLIVVPGASRLVKTRGPSLG